MKRSLSFIAVVGLVGFAAVSAERPPFVPITDKTLLNPPPDEWLMYSRTYDAQRFSPLKQITRQNVAQLKEVFKLEFPGGQQESIPLVYRGVMYVVVPPNAIRAVDATTGEQIWEHKRPSGQARIKAIAMYDDMVYWTAPDGFVQALDARTGEVRWQTKTDGGMTSGVIVVEGKVLSGRACSPVGANCYIAAHDAKTGKELWRFRTAATDSDPGGASWAGSPEAGRMAATWGLPGGYDPQRRLVFWGVANPMPNTRRARHDGKFDAIPTSAPADLYSNSTVALNPDTGKLAWYFQHLPGDDWDQDYTHERTLVRTAVNPNPKFVKWINPDVKRGEQRDVSIMVGEGGGIFVNDRATGQFLWATPFPFDAPNFLIKDIDVKTGRVHANDSVMLRQPGERHVICSYNTRSYWPTAFHPGENALYSPYVDNCLDMTAASADGTVRERRVAIAREGSDPATWAGVAKVNVSTGEIRYIHRQHAPGNGAVLATAGDVVFWGDLDHVFHAFDAASGKVLWETKLNGPIQNSTITYGVNGKQYVAVLTGVGAVTGSVIQQAGLKTNRTYNSLSVFALP